MKHFFLFCLCISLTVNCLGQVNSAYISVSVKNQTLKNGLTNNYKVDYFYDQQQGVLISHYTQPQEFVKITNRKGELKLYFPKENKLSILQDAFFSSENELLFYFVNNQLQDLGLEKEGFYLSDMRTDEEYLVFTWLAPESLKTILKVEVVFEGEKPIYSAYYNRDEKIIRKIYYYEYIQTAHFQMPLKITEISYLNEQDSIIQRMNFSNLNISNTPSSPYFNFKIPENAKVENIAD